MKRLLLFFVCFLLLKDMYSQTKLPAFGKPDLTELQMKFYDKDPEADALKLIDYQETEIIVDDYVLKVESEHRVRIKIFNKNGYKQANINIPYISHNKQNKIKDITGYVYYLDSSGRMITQKIERKQVFKDKSEDGYSHVAFTFPNLSPGCVVEYRYTKTEKNSIHLSPWFFQDKVPTLISVYRIKSPSSVSVDRRLIGPMKVNEEHTMDNSDYTMLTLKSYTLENIPAFKPEPFMSSTKDNLQRIEFTVMPRFGFFNLMMMGSIKWQTYSRFLNSASFFGKQFAVNIPGTEAIIDTAKKLETAEEKIAYLYKAVKSRLKWDESQTFYSGELEEAWKNGTGSSAEINLSLLNLLRKSGVSAYPILISTRENGKPDLEFPSLGQFNGVDVVAMDTVQLFYLDACQKKLSYKTPPLNILNRNVFLVDTTKSRWFEVIDTRPLVKNNMLIRATLDENGNMSGQVTLTSFDLAKAERMQDKNENKEDKEDKNEFSSDKIVGLDIDSLVEEFKDNDDAPLVTKFNFHYTLPSTEPYYFLDPFLFSSFRKNPFVDSLRQTDIDFGSNQDYSMTLFLYLPKGYAVDHIPQNRLLRTEDSAIIFKIIYEKQEGMLLFQNVFQLNRPIYDKEEYPALRDVFRKLYVMINEQAVIKKE